MLNLKKVIASICVIAMVLSTVAFGATFTDVAENSAYYEAVETLSKLGIVEGYEGEYRPEDGVTRAEMAKLVACIQGYGDAANGAANTAFTDVPSSHWASGYIANAAGMGIINGYGDGTFGPEDPVLYEQAIKMIMAALGYAPFAEQNGGYPTGYIAAAQRYDVSLGVSNASVGKEANRGSIAQLLANAIDTPLMVQSKWNTSGEVEYVIADGKDYDYKTLMSENLGYVKLKGIVTENTVAALGESKSIDTTLDAEVEIVVEDSFDTNNKTYLNYLGGSTGTADFLVGSSDAEDFLGYKVIAYVKNVDGEFEIISIAKDATSNDELTISLDQFEKYTDGKDNDEVEYYKDGANSTTEVTLDNGFNAVVNGVGMSGAKAFALLDKADEAKNYLRGGEITFIDTDDTKGYDTVFMTIATVGVVKKVTEDSIEFRKDVELIDGTTTNSIEIDVEDETKVFELTKDGEVVDFATLEAWDMLSLYMNSDAADVIYAEVIGTKVVGSISAVKKSNSSGNDKAYKIDGTWYDVVKGAYGLSSFGVGEGGTFYVDQFGKIAAFDEDAALATGVAGTYAYVLGTSVKESDFGGSSDVDVKLQVLTAEGIQILDFKTQVDINGTNVKEDDKGWEIDPETNKYTHDTYSDTIDELVDNVVLLTKNTSGEISKITLADSGDKKFATGTVEAGAPEKSATYDADNNRFKGDSTISVEDGAVVFMIDSKDKTDSTVGAMDIFEDEEDYYILATYKTRADRKNDIIVVKDATTKIGSKTSVAVITEVGTTDDGEGNDVKEITYLMDGAEATAITSVDIDSDVETLTVGDVVKLKVSSGVVTSLSFVWDFAEGVRDTNNLDASIKDYLKEQGTYIGDEKYDGGVIINYDSDESKVTFDGPADYYINGDDVNVYVIDTTGRELSIKRGGNIRWFDALNGTANVVVTDADNESDTTEKIKVEEAQKYADHVYVRTYDEEVADVIIVKGLKIKVK